MKARCWAASRIWTKPARESSGFLTVTIPTLPTWTSFPVRSRKPYTSDTNTFTPGGKLGPQRTQDSNFKLRVAAVDAKERDLPFGQIHRKMICIFRHFIERELTDHVRSGTVTDDTVGLQFHRGIIEEFGIARQDLSHKRDTIVGFHRFDL